MSSGLDVIRAYRPYQPTGLLNRGVSQVFNTLVLPVMSSLGNIAFALGRRAPLN